MGEPLVRQVELKNKYGLHARPAMQFVDVASKYACSVTVTLADQEVDGKSIMGVMMLAAERGSNLTISADGADAEEAMASLVSLIESNFGEV